MAIIITDYCLPIGIVGEITPFWGPAPNTILHTEPLQESILLQRWGFTFRGTRPLVEWNGLPLMLNVYTSAFADWPSYIAYSLSQKIFVVRTVQILWLGFFLGLLIQLFQSKWSPKWLLFFLFLLCSDWNFLFYKKALGATEILLQISVILMVSALIRLRESPSSRKWQYIFSGSIIIGLWSKITFVFPALVGIGFHLTLGNSLARSKKMQCFTAMFICGLLPCFMTTLIFSQWILIDIPIQSHDFFEMQWQRIQMAILGENTSIREQHHNWRYWLLDPLPFFTQAYHVPNISTHWIAKSIGYLLLLPIMWRQRHQADWKIWMGTVTLSGMLLIFIAKDLHHLVMLTPLLWIAIIQIVQHEKMWLSLPILGCFMFGNAQVLIDSSTVIEAVQTPSFHAKNQTLLRNFLIKNQVHSLNTMDYEIYGLLEVLTPQIQTRHYWPAISHQHLKVLPQILEHSLDQHLLVIEASQGMIYNLKPNQKMLEIAAESKNLHIELVDSMAGIWLYQISRISEN